ncbi:hypothetical protein ACSLNS_24840, partial [Escherichia coli]
LGSIEVRYSPVTAFTGGSAKNSLNKDIVTGLNTSDSEAGYLIHKTMHFQLMSGCSTDWLRHSRFRFALRKFHSNNWLLHQDT